MPTHAATRFATTGIGGNGSTWMMTRCTPRIDPVPVVGNHQRRKVMMPAWASSLTQTQPAVVMASSPGMSIGRLEAV